MYASIESMEAIAQLANELGNKLRKELTKCTLPCCDKPKDDTPNLQPCKGCGEEYDSDGWGLYCKVCAKEVLNGSSK